MVTSYFSGAGLDFRFSLAVFLYALCLFLMVVWFGHWSVIVPFLVILDRFFIRLENKLFRGGQWFSRIVLDLTSGDRWSKTPLSHCILSLSRILYPLLRTGSTKEQKKLSQHD